MILIQSVHIVPSYKCNLNCDYCYAKKYITEYGDLSWDDFLDYTKLLLRNNIQSVNFIGGEPTIWPYIDQAIKLLQSMGIYVGVLTNAILHTNVLPYFVTVNGNNIIDTLEDKIVQNLKWYKKNGVKITLRFNLSKEDSDELLQHRLGLIQNYADFVSIAPIVPYKLERALGKKIVEFVKYAEKIKKPIKISRAVPICLFTSEEYKYLQKKASVYSICNPGEKQIIFNPDKTFLPCVDLNQKIDLSKDFSKIENELDEIVFNLRKVYAHSQCIGCKYFKIKCQGGCFSMHLNVS